MLKVVLTANSSWNIYNFRTPFVRALKERGYEVWVVAPRDEYTSALEETVDHYVELPIESSGTSPVNDFALFCRYLKIWKEIQPDIICGYTIKPNVYGTLAAARLRIPVINNVSGLGTAFIRDNWLTKLVKRLYRFAFRYSATVFFQNPSDMTLFIQQGLVAKGKAALLPGSGVDLEHFKPSEAAGISEKYSFILIARMLWDKGVGEYVEAAKRVKAQVPDATFYLLGPVDIDNKTAIPRAEIDGWCEERAVQYLGEAKDTRPFMEKFSCVVLPSYREGMSRVLLEGAAMAKPLIATNVPGCADVVTDGRNGFLCELQDSESLAEAMLKYIHLSDQQKDSMSMASRKVAEEKFDEKIVVELYLNALAKSGVGEVTDKYKAAA